MRGSWPTASWMDWLAGCCIEINRDFARFEIEEQEGMKVRLNLATKPLESHRRFLAGASLTALVASVVFVALGWHVYYFREAVREKGARREYISKEHREEEAADNELRV